MNKGADGQDIFSFDDDRRMFEDLIEQSAQRAGIEVHGYCLMSNHFHMVLHCPDGKLSSAMHGLCSRYARWYNARYQRRGPVFTNRFNSVPIGDDRQLLATVRYVHRNPLSFVALADLAAYRWSSLPAYIGQRPRPAWLSTDVVLGLHGGAEALSRHCHTPLPSDGAGVDSVYPIDVGCEEVERAVMATTRAEAAALRESVRGTRNTPRILAVMLAVELRCGSTADVAERFGLSSQSAARVVARRGRVLAAADDRFADLRKRAIAHLHTAA